MYRFRQGFALFNLYDSVFLISYPAGKTSKYLFFYIHGTSMTENSYSANSITYYLYNSITLLEISGI